MKKILALLVPALVLGAGALVQTNAFAKEQVGPAQQTPIVVTPQQTPHLLQSVITGTIHVPALPASLSGFSCSKLAVFATSKEYVQPPTGFAYPKWTRSDVSASGNWASGTCTYSIVVPADSAFTLSTNGKTGAPFHCDAIPAYVTNTGGTLIVPKATTKTQNFTINSMGCEVLH